MKTAILFLAMIFCIGIFAQSVSVKDPCDSITKVKVDSTKKAAMDSIALIKKSEAAKYAKELGLGNINPWIYFWGIIYGFCGVLFVYLALAYQGMKYSPTTPDNWSWKELFNHVNIKKRIVSLVLTTMVIFLTMRFPLEFGVSETITMFGCLIVGMSIDFFIAKILSFRKIETNSNTNPA